METVDVLERNFPGRRSALKREILLAALHCFNEHGLDLTTIDMIKARCDTSVGSIYHHFGSRDGVISALFFSSMEDQERLLTEYLADARHAEEGVVAIVYSYVDWVTEQPALARFQYQARSLVSKGPGGPLLAERNRARRVKMDEWWREHAGSESMASVPEELLSAFILGPAESYCRAWLTGRAIAPPATYREQLGKAATLSVGAKP